MKQNTGKCILLAAVICCMLIFSTCVKPPEYSNVPRIEFVSVNKTSFSEVTGDVSMYITIYFEDGDGDLGGNIDDSLNMFWEDSRVPGYYLPFKIPFIELQGNHDDISGNIYVTWSVSCLNTIDTSNVENFTYNIYIVDRAGNESNIITTPGLAVTCEE